MEARFLNPSTLEPPENIETSIIIRTKNEGKWLGTLLQKLFAQTYQDFEVIIIDSGSTDKTLEIAKKFKVKIWQIPPADFSYPYALNYAIKHAQASKYIVALSAHSIPLGNTFLEDGIQDFSLDNQVIGVYGKWKALPGSTFWDKVLINGSWYLIFSKLKHGISIKSKPALGILQCTNAMFLKSFWDKRQFNEIYGAGGEDYEWAKYWMKQGYKVVLDKRLTVYHSHNLSLLGWILQVIYWYSLIKPRSFKPLKFRKSPTHS